MRIDLKVAQRISESRRLNEGLSPDSKTFEVYHRTGSYVQNGDINALTDLVQSIIKGGFRSGTGAMYGRGFYSTGDFESQFGMRGQKYGNMAGNYGMAIIKYQVPTKGLFVFDYRLAKKIYGGNTYTLADQYHKIAPNEPIPHVIEVLSDDLEQTLVDPKLSADRAYAFWGRFLYHSKGKPGVKFWLDYDTAPPSAVLNAYESLTKSDYKDCDIYTLPGSTGIAYAGNADGNAVFIKDDSKSILKPLMYCIMDYTKPTDKKAFVVPWTKVSGAAATGATGAGCLVDILSAAGIPRGGNSFISVYAEGYPKDGNTATIDFIKQDFPWTVSPLCHFSKLMAVFCGGKKDYIINGVWERGKCTAHVFGNSIPSAEGSSFNSTGASLCDDKPIFRGGEFEGDMFGGIMEGGVFRRGEFEGVFKGGAIDFDGRVTWVASGFTRFESLSTSSCAIKCGGKIYKIGGTPPDVYLANLKSGVDTTSSAIASTLADTIKANLAFDVNDFRIAGNWRKAASIAQGFAAFKQAYPYLFAKVGGALWYVPPLIRVTDDKIICDSGTLSGRAIYFDVWGEDTTVASGIVKRSNGQASITEFNGTFNGGIFEGGVFNGVFNGGILNVDLTVWNNSAKWRAGSNPQFMHNGKVMALDPRALLLPDAQGNLKYPTIQDIIAGVKSGEIMKDLKKFDMSVKLAKQNGLPPPELVAFSVRKNKLDIGLTQAAINKSLAKMAQDKEWSMDESIASFDTSEARWVEMGGRVPFSEKEFTYQELSDEEQAKLYDVFYDTYTKVTGASFTRPDFDWRAAGWIFYGEPPDRNNPNARVGGISVRRQVSNNMYRLTSSFGHPIAVLKGFTEFSARHGNDPSWGIVTAEIARMITKRDKAWKTLPGTVLKAMEDVLKKLSRDVQSVGLNGVMKVSTPAGVMDKVFVANRTYIDWLLDSIEDPANASKLPVPQIVLKPVVGLLRALM